MSAIGELGAFGAIPMSTAEQSTMHEPPGKQREPARNDQGAASLSGFGANLMEG